MKERTLNSYLKELNSDTPAPGGGSAAAYVAAMAISLVNMALKVSIKRKSFLSLPRQEQDNVLHKIAYFDAKVDEVKGYMQQDEEAFSQYLIALKSHQNIAQHQINCLNVPLNLAKEMLRLIQDFQASAPYIVTSIKGDLDMGLILAIAVLKGCLVNIKINVEGLQDVSIKNESLQWIKTIEATIANMK